MRSIVIPAATEGRSARVLQRLGLLLLAAWLFPAYQAAASERPVRVRIEGVADAGLRAELELLSENLWQGARPPASEAAFGARASRHAARLARALEARGYYAAEVGTETAGEAGRWEVTYRVTPGPVYPISQVKALFFDGPGGAAQPAPPLLTHTGLTVGAPAVSADILDAERRLAESFQDEGYAFAEVFDRRVVVNHDTRAAQVSYLVALGPRLRTGAARIEGLQAVDERAVLRELPWREGSLYRHDQLRQARDRLLRTGLFSSVQVAPAPPDARAGDTIPIVITVSERKHRTVAVGLQYRTDEGVGLSAQWEHRNFAGLGRRLRLQMDLSELEQSLAAYYDLPQWRRPDQSLTLQLKTSQLDPGPYRSQRIDLGAWVERELTPHWSVGLGPALRLSRVEERRQTTRYYLVSFPTQVSADYRDDRLDPARGFRLTDRLTPFVDVTDLSVSFVRNEATFMHYQPLEADGDWVLATRLRIGMIGGAGTRDIPADERFYAGGGGSVRGYGYQKVGPLDRHGDSVGGRSLTDWSFEIRKRITDTLGAAVFLDGGAAYASSYPDFGIAPRWGAGAGIRYFTPVGPLRLDVGLPLNRRPDIDSSVQFYLSIGQAF